ncbi:MAG: hypothetical protein JW908_06095 [Anaerolineales bacterium]|nr:hypothetical protein [Anaerolineales bacterium]
MEHALVCPQCNAPLSPHRFARSATCPYCGVVVHFEESTISAARFREAFGIWNSPISYQIGSWISIGDRHWALDKLIAHGEIADVYSGRLARWPTEFVIAKILRNHKDVELLSNEWNSLQSLQHSDAPGADTFAQLLPQPIIHGEITNGMFIGNWVSIFRWASGFKYNFEEVLGAYPKGIPPRASIWVWRRILEVLSFIHASGMAHGAVLPPHLLIQENEHGVRLVGYDLAGRLGEALNRGSSEYDSFYPKFAKSKPVLTTQLDIVMSARCIVAILGGEPENATLPAAIPSKLADIVQRIALTQPDGISNQSAWAVREKLGQIAEDVFGPSQFIPIEMPV